MPTSTSGTSARSSSSAKVLRSPGLRSRASCERLVSAVPADAVHPGTAGAASACRRLACSYNWTAAITTGSSAAPRLVLLAAMDDATSEVLAAEFRAEEDAYGYLSLFRTPTHTKGVPVAVYSDCHGIFHRRKQLPLTLAEQLRGGPDPTQVQRALQELGVRWIPASSPKAKGRIEPSLPPSRIACAPSCA